MGYIYELTSSKEHIKDDLKEKFLLDDCAQNFVDAYKYYDKTNAKHFAVENDDMILQNADGSISFTKKYIDDYFSKQYEFYLEILSELSLTKFKEINYYHLLRNSIKGNDEYIYYDEILYEKDIFMRECLSEEISFYIGGVLEFKR